MGDAITQTIEKFFDNSLENIGRGNSVRGDKRIYRTRLTCTVDVSGPTLGPSRHCSLENVQGYVQEISG